jgi:hypothetical protein
METRVPLRVILIYFEMVFMLLVGSVEFSCK